MARKKTQRQLLKEEAADRGLLVRTWSPGDGITRYRFFDKRDLKRHKVSEREQTYSGPDNGVCTALGLKSAFKFLYTGTCPRGRR